MNTKNILIGIGSLIAGVTLTMVLVYNSAAGIMMIEKPSKYGFEETVEKFKANVKKAGWKMPTVHNLQKTMKKFGKDVDQVMVFELCHPEHAYKILSKSMERIVSSMMPCRISIYKKSDGKTYISMMNTKLMGQMMDGVVPEVMGIASKESFGIISPLIVN